MKRIKRTNTVVVKNLLQEQENREGGIRKDSYMMKVDRERNCYNCEKFGYLARYCKS